MGRIELQGLLNTRDLGGLIGAEGKTVKPRRLIRSGALYDATAEDLKTLSALGVRDVVDLRTPVERDDAPDPADAGFRCTHLPLLDDSFFGIAQDSYSVMTWLDLFSDHSVSPDEVFLEMYRKLLFDARVIPLWRRFFGLLLDAGDAVLWHCSAGKDRAGVATVLALTALGVSRADAVADYMLTGVYTAPEIEAVERSASQLSQDPHVRRAVATLMEVNERCVTQLFDLTDRQYGGMLNYLYETEILSPAQTVALREKYLEK